MSRKGFSLVEVMVALTIASIVAIAAHSGLATLMDVSQRAARHRAEMAQAAAVRGQLAEWLRGAYLDEQDGSDGFLGVSRTPVHGSSDDRLRFQTRVARSLGADRLEMVQVTIWVERGASAPLGTLLAEISHPAEAGDPMLQWQTTRVQTEVTHRLVLVRNVSGFSARYLFAAGGERHWLPVWASVLRLPEAVRINIEGDSVPGLLRVPLTVGLVTGG